MEDTGFTSHAIDGVIQDSWEEIIENIHKGKPQKFYQIGDMKELDMGSEGLINMQIVGFDVDDLADGSGKAKTSWLSKDLMKTEHRWNPAKAYHQNDVVKAAWVKDVDDGYMSNNQKIGSSTAKATFTLIPKESGVLTISYKVSSENYSDKLNVLVNGNHIASLSGEVDWTTFDVNAMTGTEIIIEASYSKNANGNSGLDTAWIKWSGIQVLESTDIGTVIEKVNDSLVNGTGTIGGWLHSELREYYRNYLFSLMPDNVQNAIVSVNKIQQAFRIKEYDPLNCELYTQESIETVWCPSYPELFYSKNNGGLYETIFPNNPLRVKYKVNATSSSWWVLRSAWQDWITYCVSDAGAYGAANVVKTYGLSLGFCI